MIVSRLLLTIEPDDAAMKLGRGAITAAAEFFHLSRITIRKIWQRVLANFRNPNIRAFTSSSCGKGNSGGNQKRNRDEVCEAVKALPLCQRRTIRSLAHALSMPKSTQFDMEEDKRDTVIMQRVLCCCSKFNAADNRYHDFYDSVHIDEKWFFISEKQLRVYIATDEEAPARFAQDHDHLIKVILLCAVSRPSFNTEVECTFDGIIGMWLFVEFIPARRQSVNRPRGAIITTVVTCTRERYRRMLIENLLPAMRVKWPNRERTILIQQDGATAHVCATDPEFRLHATQGLWDIRIETQAAKSPDTNV